MYDREFGKGNKQLEHFKQVKSFYDALTEKDKQDLCLAIAEDIYFLEEDLLEEILALLHKAVPQMSEKIREINSFTF